ncbi:hypothetical protein [Streptomyces sp. HUAS ZL42]|uniref:hypothetical protein n=1 Tax=Streptomyces sp. HUAS ZL42 TaxID=3231715 RepID=UPI00345E2C6E
MAARPSRKSLANTAAVSALALAATLTGAAVAPSTAAADTGDRTQTVGCESLYVNDSSGVTHARLRNCTVTWGKNIFDGSYWQTVKFELLDARTDGVCARSNVIVSPSGAGAQASECNGVWTAKTANFGGRATNIFIRIAYGSNSTYGKISTNVTPPSGF